MSTWCTLETISWSDKSTGPDDESSCLTHLCMRTYAPMFLPWSWAICLAFNSWMALPHFPGPVLQGTMWWLRHHSLPSIQRPPHQWWDWCWNWHFWKLHSCWLWLNLPSGATPSPSPSILIVVMHVIDECPIFPHPKHLPLTTGLMPGASGYGLVSYAALP